MSKPHIAFFVGPSVSHLKFSLPIASELAKRGFHVTYFVTKDLSKIISESGAEPIIYDISILDVISSSPPEIALNWSDYSKLLKLSLNVFSLIPEIINHYDKNKPDLIVYDSIFWCARVLQKKWDVPAVQMIIDFVYPEGFLEIENGVYTNPAPIAKFQNQLDEIFRNYGIFGKNNYRHLEILNIAFIPKEFQYNNEEFCKKVKFVGYCFPPLSKRREEVPRKIKPTILATSTSAISEKESHKLFFEKISTALCAEDVDLILSVGKSIGDKTLRPLPKNFIVNKDIPNVELLEKADIFICHGGLLSILESLYFGVPLIVIPNNIYHEALGYRVHQLGLGIMLLREDFTPENLRYSIAKIQGDKQIRDNVIRMKEAIWDANGTEVSANLIINQLTTKIRTDKIL